MRIFPIPSRGRLPLRDLHPAAQGALRQGDFGSEARALTPDYAEWEITVPAGATRLSAFAEDAAGNKEQRPHILTVP